MASVKDGNRPALGENSRVVLVNPANAAIYVMRVIDGDVVDDPERIDATDNTSKGFRENSRGPVGCTVDLNAFWRASDNVIAVNGVLAGLGPKLKAGEIANYLLYIYPDFLNSPTDYHYFPQFFVITNRVRIEGVGLTRYALQVTNQGPFKRLNEASLPTAA